MDMVFEFIGAVGMILIVSGWILVLRDTPPPPSLSGLYAVGSMLLTIYAIVIQSTIFAILNLLAFIFSVINLIRSYKIRKSFKA